VWTLSPRFVVDENCYWTLDGSGNPLFVLGEDAYLAFNRSSNTLLEVLGAANTVFERTPTYVRSYKPLFVRPGAANTPAANGEVTFQLTDNTTITWKARGSDGTVRSGTITLS